MPHEREREQYCIVVSTWEGWREGGREGGRERNVLISKMQK